MSLRLRAYAPADAPVVIDLWVRAWQATLPDIDFEARRGWFAERLTALAAEGYVLTVVMDDATARIAGLTAVHPGRHHLDQIAVDPDHWGTPAAALLIAHAKATGNGALELDVNQENPRGVAFYEKHGFRRIRADVNPVSGRATWWYRWP